VKQRSRGYRPNGSFQKPYFVKFGDLTTACFTLLCQRGKKDRTC
jgi:hypothetical protein